MAQQTINIGSVPNDGTGDPIRTAFTKANDNFTELYTGTEVFTAVDATVLETAHPAASNAGHRAVVGSVNYISDGVAWMPIILEHVFNDDGDSTILDRLDRPLSTLTPTFTPYKLAFWGDSRYNGIAAGDTYVVLGTGIYMTQYRAPTWVPAYMGDSEYAYTFAISGDAVLNWNAASRSGREYTSLNNCDADLVFVQIGVNDIASGYTVASTFEHIKRLSNEIIKSGKALVLESVMPVGSAYPNAFAVQSNLDELNGYLADFCNTLPQHIVTFADTATALKDENGYAKTTYYAADAIHPIRTGAQIQGQILAASARKLLPKRVGVRHSNNWGQSLISQTSPFSTTIQFASLDKGTAIPSMSSGKDELGFYYEWTWTPNSFAYDECLVRCTLAVNFNTAYHPAYSVSAGEIYQASAYLVLDDGNAGAPNAYQVSFRQRFYTDSKYCDWCNIAAPSSTSDPDYSDPLKVTVVTPMMRVDTASVVAAPSAGAGYVVDVLVESRNLGLPCRLRLYNPQLNRVDYATTPRSITPPASGATYTNNSQCDEYVIVSGGTVSSIACNGVTLGITSGTVVLSRNDSMAITYSVAPSMLVKRNPSY